MSALKKIFGIHYVIEFSGCDPTVIRSAECIKKILLEACKKAGVKVLNASFHQFRGGGASGIVLVSESHFSIHTWPEHKYAAVDILTCGQNMTPEKAITFIRTAFRSKKVSMKKLKRGF